MPANPPQVEAYDYALFGPVERRPQSRIRQVIARRLSASWSSVPHVAHFDELDLGALQSLRANLAQGSPEGAPGLLAFVMKACARALLAFPEFNASLDADGTVLVLKQYCHIAFAAETPMGLLAPVVRDVDKRSLADTEAAIAALAGRARAGRLGLGDAEGACFTVSNLGKLGGTGFTPIINAPEVAILGVARAERRVVEGAHEGTFAVRTLLPLCLVYDHRVIDGAVGARFMAHLLASLAQPAALLEG